MTATGATRPFATRLTLADALLGGAARSMLLSAVLVVAGAVLTALAAQVSFTAPWTTVPYTLQTGSVLLVGTALGSRRGALSMALYVAAGAIGLPVYAAGDHGLARLLGATGGYLVGFVIAAAIVGWLAERGWDRSSLSTLGLMAVGTLVIYAIGVPVLAVVVRLPLTSAVESGALVFAPWDALKALAAAGLLPLAWRLTRQR
ncbi:MAG TPA: biotin transporter BioY [Candidatus Limnocylindria bacterium]|nr:biotin transporter BioY [Candidatus Limnocylindria bacterium]